MIGVLSKVKLCLKVFMVLPFESVSTNSVQQSISLTAKLQHVIWRIKKNELQALYRLCTEWLPLSVQNLSSKCSSTANKPISATGHHQQCPLVSTTLVVTTASNNKNVTKKAIKHFEFKLISVTLTVKQAVEREWRQRVLSGICYLRLLLPGCYS